MAKMLRTLPAVFLAAASLPPRTRTLRFPPFLSWVCFYLSGPTDFLCFWFRDRRQLLDSLSFRVTSIFKGCGGLSGRMAKFCSAFGRFSFSGSRPSYDQALDRFSAAALSTRPRRISLLVQDERFRQYTILLSVLSLGDPRSLLDSYLPPGRNPLAVGGVLIR